MKKLLLSLSVAILALPTLAQETYNWDYETTGKGTINANNKTEGTIGLGSITWDYRSDIAIAVSNDGTFKGIGLGNKNFESTSVTISTDFFVGKNIVGISIGLGAANSSEGAAYAILIDGQDVKCGSVSATGNAKNNKETATWEGSTSCGDSFSFNFTTPDKKQFFFGPITITYTDDANAKQSAGLSYSQETVTLYADEVSTFEAPTLSNPNSLTPITYSSDNTQVATVTDAGVVSLTGTAGEAVITANFEGNDEYYAGSASYTITVKPALEKVTSVAATKALTDGTEFIVGYPLTVAFVNGSNIFVVDEDGDFIQIYGSNSYAANDIIPAGWTGKYTLYSGAVPEIMPVDALPASTGQGSFTPEEVQYADITTAMFNSVVVIPDVTFSEATTAERANFTGKCGETDVTFYNNYSVASVEAGTYDVTVVVANYRGDVSLYVISYKSTSTSGIGDITVADDDAPVEYYNLQGVRVDNPESGLYIRRQGRTATKVLVK